MTKSRPNKSVRAGHAAGDSRAVEQKNAEAAAERKKNALYVAIIILVAIVGGAVLVVLSKPQDETKSAPADIQGTDMPLPEAVLREPDEDGWDTEFFSEQAQDQLKLLLKAVFHQPVEAAEFAAVLSDDFSGQLLRPAALDVAHQADGLTVRRRSPASATASSSDNEALPAAKWIATLPSFCQAVALGVTPQSKTKVFRVEQMSGAYSTDVIFQSAARTESQSVQVNAVWRCRWQQSDKNDAPRLSAITIQDYEEVVYEGPDPARFSDCTLAIVGSEEVFRRQLAPGLDHWLDSTPKIFDRARWGDQGLALGDVNGDGRDDIYVCEPGALPNRLFVVRFWGEGLPADEIAAAAGTIAYELFTGVNARVRREYLPA